MKSWSMPFGKVAGVTLRLHLSFGLLLLFVLATGALQTSAGGAAKGLALVGFIFGSVLLHELGHALMARRRGLLVKAVILLPIGGITVYDEENGPRASAQDDLQISAAGPAVNLFLALLAGSLLPLIYPQSNLLTKPWVSALDLPRSLFWTNVFLGAFNLLPAYPMDGGRVLRAWFAQRMDPLRATRKAISIGQFFSFLFVFVGILCTVSGESSGMWLSMIGVFLFLGAQIEDRTAVFQTVLQSIRMSDVMLTDFKTLSPADTLQGAIEKAVHWLQDDFPVVRGTEMIGAISRQKILEALRSEGNGYVQSAMVDIGMTANACDTLSSVLRRLHSRENSLIPVVDDGRLVGIVTMQNLSHSMAMLAESRRLKQMEEDEEDEES